MRQLLVLFVPLALLAGPADAEPGFKTIENDPWCREVGRNSHLETWCEVREATLPATEGRIEVDASPNGGARARGADRSDIRLRVMVVARADTEAEARDLASEVEVVTGPTIRAEGPRAHPRGAHWWASFEVRVPRRSSLRLTSKNGPVAVSGVEGGVEMETQNGPVSVSGSGGQVRGRTENGPVTAELTGTTWTGKGLDLETVNGPAVIRVPKDYNARLETGTVNGPLDLSFPLTGQLRSKGDIQATLGNGGTLLRVRTTNGPVRVGRP
jgi:hypothetical protein